MTTRKIAFWGDSITEGVPGCSYIDRLALDPEAYRLENFGKAGDTVISLYHRLKAQELDADYDLIFLFVGVNDVFVKLSWSYGLMKMASKQPWARSEHAFAATYRKTLDLLAGKSRHVIAVSPLCLGEDLNSKWNSQLSQQREHISALTAQFGNVEYLNLYEDAFKPLLLAHQSEEQDVPNYLPTSATRVALDALLLRTTGRVDGTSEKRELFLTLDGVHLNDRGATVVAQAFRKRIEAVSRRA